MGTGPAGDGVLHTSGTVEVTTWDDLWVISSLFAVAFFFLTFSS